MNLRLPPDEIQRMKEFSLVCAMHPLKAVDLHVYHAATRGFFFSHSSPMYGPNAGLGWPMINRYPPLFLCLFRPFGFFPLWVVAGLWAGLEVVFLKLFLRV